MISICDILLAKSINSIYLFLTMADEGAVSGCITVRDVAPAKFISAYTEVLKNNDKFVVPKWADIVKTGVAKELAPYDPDWYFVRAGKDIIYSIVSFKTELIHIWITKR